MGGDDAKKRILARRARFIAAALAGVTVSACGSESGPSPCLTPLADGGAQGDANGDAAPMPCLSPPARDASADADADAGIGDAATDAPRPCLVPMR